MGKIATFMGDDVTSLGKSLTSVGNSVTSVGKNKKRLELKKHAATIHCSNTLSLLQRKIANALLYHAYPELLQKEEHEITVKQLCKLIGYFGNNHAVIKDAFKGLLSTILEWNVLHETSGQENWTASSIIASVSIEGPNCYYAYSPRMKQLLHAPSVFGKIDLIIQSKFRSSYGLALYENCIRYRKLPATKWFDLDLFKKLMGVPEGKYTIFRDFKRRVLDKAIDEVNTYSDLFIQAEYGHEGRRVSKMRFILSERAKRTRLGENFHKQRKISQQAENDLATTLMNKFALTKTQIKKLKAHYDESFLTKKMALVEASKAYVSGEIKNLAAYFLSAVKNDYQQASSMEVKPETKTIKSSDAKLIADVEEIKALYLSHRQCLVAEFLAAIPETQMKDFMINFEKVHAESIKTTLKLQRKKYKPENFHASPQIQALMRQHGLQYFNIPVTSMDEFINTLESPLQLSWYKLKSSQPDHPLFLATN